MESDDGFTLKVKKAKQGLDLNGNHLDQRGSIRSAPSAPDLGAEVRAQSDLTSHLNMAAVSASSTW